jgi:hypothetical protein
MVFRRVALDYLGTFSVRWRSDNPQRHRCVPHGEKRGALGAP